MKRKKDLPNSEIGFGDPFRDHGRFDTFKYASNVFLDILFDSISFDTRLIELVWV